MKQNLLIVMLVAIFLVPCYLLAQETDVFRQEGIASWYGREFDGRPTASGEIYDSSLLTAAHPNLPFGTILVVTNQHNNRQVTVRVNDRGPFVAARIIDVSRAAAERLDMIITGTAPVIIESVERMITSPVVELVVPVEEVLNETPRVVEVPPVNVTETHVQQPVVPRIRLIPEMNIMPNRTYRLQVGSYRVARNAVETFERLKNAGLDPAYERFTDTENVDYFRVVLPGIRGTDIQSTTERLMVYGFREALIREEN